LRDTATGNVRKTLTLEGTVTGETWLGEPAIVVRGERIVPSDGLTMEETFRTVHAYDERGERIGAVELPGEGEAQVQDGWIIEPTGVRNTSVRVRRADDSGPGRVFTCAPGDDCSFSTRGPRPSSSARARARSWSRARSSSSRTSRTTPWNDTAGSSRSTP